MIEGQYTEPKELQDPNNKEEKAMTTKEKLAKLNELRVANNMKPLRAWKQSVAKLDAALDKLTPSDDEVVEETIEEVVEPDTEILVTEEVDDSHVELKDRFGTIRAASEHLLLEKDSDGEGLPYKYILRAVHTNFPKAKTSLACLRWYANKMNQRGEIMPDRKSGNSKK